MRLFVCSLAAGVEDARCEMRPYGEARFGDVIGHRTVVEGREYFEMQDFIPLRYKCVQIW